MPMDLLMFPEMSLYPLIKSIECRANVDISSFLKVDSPLFAYDYRLSVLEAS